MLMTFAYLRAASLASASVFAPVHTILPELKMSAVVFGARIRMIAAAKRCKEKTEEVRVSIKRRSGTLKRCAPRRVRRRLGFPLTFGLYSTLRAWNAMVFRSSLQSRLTVATMFLRYGKRGSARWFSGAPRREREGAQDPGEKEVPFELGRAHSL